jgi:hypothetical protein
MHRLRSLVLILLALGAGASALAQSATYSGTVRDAASGETLVGANVYAPAFALGTVTNAYGFFSLTLPSTDTAAVVVSYVGYLPQALRLAPGGGRLTVELEPARSELGAVEVVAEEQADPLDAVQMSAVSLTIREVQSLPALLGEVDVLKALQLLPGVQSGAEGTSGLYVRGGGPDQNLLLLDGAPVYNASHLFGFFSTFNADALKSVDLIKGGFPARYGGRLSSVLDLRMKEGNMREVRGEGAVGIVASRLTLEGPIVRDRASFLVSGRRTYIDLLAQPFLREDEQAGYYFYDLNAKANAVLSPRDRVYASLYTGRDRFHFAYEEPSYRNEGGLDWGNVTATLRLNRVLSDRAFVNGSLLYSRYRFNVFSRDVERRFEGGERSFEARYTSGIEDVGGRVDLEWVPAPQHYLRMGGEITRHRYRPGAVQARGDDAAGSVVLASPEIPTTEAMLYVEDDLRLSPRLTVNVGAHASGFATEDASFFSLQPRLAGRLRVGPSTAVRASYAAMRQYVHLLSNAGIGLPTDLWLPATATVPPQAAQQVALGVTRTFGPRYEVAVEAYYKAMDGLIEYREGASFFNTAFESWQEQVVSGTGRAYGVEVHAQKKTGRTTGWVGYTLAWSNRQFDALNEGERFPYRYDRRHDVSVVLTHWLSRRLELAGTWVYGTGSAISLPIGRMPGYPDAPGSGGNFGFTPTLEEYGPRNGFRMPAYHRLDVSLNHHRTTRWGERTISLGAYNAYNRKNPFFVMLTQEWVGGEVRPQFKQFSLFPVLPALSYRFRF